MKRARWKQILFVAAIGLLIVVIALCFWYYFAAYTPFVQHLSRNQAYFDYVYSLYLKHALRASTTIQQILNNF